MPTDPRSERFLRYSGLVSPAQLTEASVLIVGVGAIGRQVALQLASMGVGTISLQDMDTVEEVNLGPQGYRPDQIGQNKAETTFKDLQLINPELKGLAIPHRLTEATPGLSFFSAVFVCVDSMETRKLLLTGDTPCPAVGIDARMSALVAQSLYVNDKNRAEYEQTLFSDEEAHPAPCTARSTIFTSSIAAGMMVTQFVQGLNGPVPLPFASLDLNSWVLDQIATEAPPAAEEESVLQEEPAELTIEEWEQSPWAWLIDHPEAYGDRYNNIDDLTDEITEIARTINPDEARRLEYQVLDALNEGVPPESLRLDPPIGSMTDSYSIIRVDGPPEDTAPEQPQTGSEAPPQMS